MKIYKTTSYFDAPEKYTNDNSVGYRPAKADDLAKRNRSSKKFEKKPEYYFELLVNDPSEPKEL